MPNSPPPGTALPPPAKVTAASPKVPSPAALAPLFPLAKVTKVTAADNSRRTINLVNLPALPAHRDGYHLFTLVADKGARTGSPWINDRKTSPNAGA
jgi:hypothetical protein